MPKPQLITFQGKSLSRQQWADITGIPSETIAWRHRQGMSPELILSKADLRPLGTGYPLRKSTVSKAKKVQTIAQNRDLTFDDYERLSDDYDANSVMIDEAPPKVDHIITVRDSIVELAKPTKERRDPVHTRRTLLTFKGQTRTVEHWAYLRGMRIADLLSRLKAGESVEACLAETVWVEPRRHEVKSKRGRDVVQDVPAFRMRVPSAAEFARMLKAA